MAGKKPLKDQAHVRLYRHELESAAYRSLTPDARALLVEFRSLYAGRSNRIHLSLREAMRRLGVGRRRAQSAIDDLQDRGFIRLLAPGSFSTKTRHAPEYALLNEPLDGSRTPEKPFMSWRPPANEKSDKPEPQKSSVYTVNTDGVRHVHRDSGSVYAVNTDGVHGEHRGGQKPPSLGVRHVHTDSYQVGADKGASGGAIGCPCGGMAYPKKSQRGGAVLRWKECGACGRCGRFVLHVDGECVARGSDAQSRYNEVAA